MKVDLWILTGFLGSGKTTVLNNFLRSTNEDERVGVLVNDFGELGVDASLVQAPAKAMGPSGEMAADSSVPVVELNGGQIFCSCLAGSFVDSLSSLVEQNVERIFVEGSGLAKPGPIHDIVSEAVTASAGRLHHRGTICIVDAKRFHALRSVVNAVDEQLYYADLVVVNKTDEVDRHALAAVHEEIGNVNPRAPVIDTEFGRLTLEEIAEHLAVKEGAGRQAGAEILTGAASRPAESSASGSSSLEPVDITARFRGWNGSGRPIAAVFQPERPVAREELETALRNLLPGTFRAKGYLASVEEGPDWFVSAIGAEFSVHRANGGHHSLGLSIIAPANLDIDDRMHEAVKNLEKTTA